MGLGNGPGERTFLLQLAQSPVDGVLLKPGAENCKIWRLCLSLILIQGDSK